MSTRDGAREENLLNAIRSANVDQRELAATLAANTALALLVNKQGAEIERLQALVRSMGGDPR
jgi:hypothetical protein